MSHQASNLMSKIEDSINAYFVQYPSSNKFNREKPKVLLQEPSWSAEEVFAFSKPLLTTQVTLGENVKKFESQVCEKFGHKFGISSNSGSSANLLAVSAICSPLALKQMQKLLQVLIGRRLLKPGDEVLVPAVSWSTTVWPLIQNKLIPVIVDSDFDSMNVDVKKLPQALSSQTKGIMLVHVFGNPCQMDEIMKFAEQNKLTVIEDCCESLGSQFNGRVVGTFGLAGTYSFYFSHHICSIEGGMTMTEDEDLTEIMKIIRSHGWSRESQKYHAICCKDNSDLDPRYIFPDIGYNIRPTEPASAMGVVQLGRLDGFIEKRRQAAESLLSKISKYSDYFHFQKETSHGFHTWFNLACVVKECAPFSKKDICQFLNENSIETRPIIAGNIARQPALKFYKHRIGNSLDSSNKIMDSGFAVPTHQGVCSEAIQYMADVIEQFVQKF